jgi:hypothetical protein
METIPNSCAVCGSKAAAPCAAGQFHGLQKFMEVAHVHGTVFVGTVDHGLIVFPFVGRFGCNEKNRIQPTFIVPVYRPLD